MGPLSAPPQRVAGVDVARALALLAMMSVHILPGGSPGEEVPLVFMLFAGRASALFALLAGTGLALATGGTSPRLRPRRPVVATVLARGAVVALVGLGLGGLPPPVAVILVNYGLLFVLGAAVLGWPVRTLLWSAAAVVVLTPLLSHALRSSLPPGPGAQPSLALLGSPVVLGRQLVLTGYYPVLSWSAYLLVGLAVGRLPLDSRGTAARLLVVGTVIALAARLTSDALLRSGGLAALRAAGPSELVRGGDVGRLQLSELFGTAPTTSWWWQAVAAPHTGTAFDLAQTTGSALAVLGAVLLLVPLARGPSVRAVDVLAATGSTTLTLYTLHVLALWLVPVTGSALVLAVHVTVALVLATAWRTGGRRGPLEQVASRAAARAGRWV